MCLYARQDYHRARLLIIAIAYFVCNSKRRAPPSGPTARRAGGHPMLAHTRKASVAPALQSTFSIPHRLRSRVTRKNFSTQPQRPGGHLQHAEKIQRPFTKSFVRYSKMVAVPILRLSHLIGGKAHNFAISPHRKRPAGAFMIFHNTSYGFLESFKSFLLQRFLIHIDRPPPCAVIALNNSLSKTSVVPFFSLAISRGTTSELLNKSQVSAKGL